MNSTLVTTENGRANCTTCGLCYAVPGSKKQLKKNPAQPTLGNTRMAPPNRKQVHIAAAYFDHSGRVRRKKNAIGTTQKP